MKRDADNDARSDAEEDGLPKRARGNAAAEPADLVEQRAMRTFDECKAMHIFKAQHHPESLAGALLAQREHAQSALPGFVSDLTLGALTGPSLVDAGLLAGLPGHDLAPGDPPASPPRGQAPLPWQLVKFEPLPSAVVAHARGTLIACAAGRAEGAGRNGRSALVSLLLAEPINGTTRMWAAYEQRDEAEAGAAALSALPQLAELADAPLVQRDTLMPAREDVPPPLAEADMAEHSERADRLRAA